MNRLIVLLLPVLPALCAVRIAAGDATPRGNSYMGYEHWGGTWSDAEKDSNNAAEESRAHCLCLPSGRCWPSVAAQGRVAEWVSTPRRRMPSKRAIGLGSRAGPKNHPRRPFSCATRGRKGIRV